MTISKYLFLYGGIILLAALSPPLLAQQSIFGLDDPRAQLEPDPCASDPALAKQLLEILGPGYGYNIDSLLTDLQRWQSSPHVQITTVGASVQNRPLWLVTIADTLQTQMPRYRIAIHARTHPQEVQSSWVTNEIIKLLLADNDFARSMRRHCVFNIIPMYNPDGVELGNARTNANGVDLERQWAATYPEPETAALKDLYGQLMDSELPIRVALNMHSSSLGKRHFVFHHENGTSPAFVGDQQRFIGLIKGHWLEGISGWDTAVSWINGTPNYYPESWFWLNYHDAVMALTYEDVYGETWYGFDRAANAIVAGLADYLGISAPSAIVQHQVDRQNTRKTTNLKVYPNPVPSNANAMVTVRALLAQDRMVTLTLYDLLGRKVMILNPGRTVSGQMELQLSTINLARGLYFLHLSGGEICMNAPFTIQ